MESTWVSPGKIKWLPFKKPHRMDYLGEFTTAYDLALSPEDLETGFYQHLQHRSICYYWVTLTSSQRMTEKKTEHLYISSYPKDWNTCLEYEI